ncbi:MAG: hypothetical protein R2728_05795 [Chitinophagales bacterium]
MKVHPNEILIYYDPNMSVAKKAIAYANSISSKVNMIEYHKEHFTPTIWRQILDMLQLEPKQLVNKAHEYYQENLRGNNYGIDDWINILTHRPDIIRAPIVIKGNTAIFVVNPTDIYRLK